MFKSAFRTKLWLLIFIFIIILGSATVIGYNKGFLKTLVSMSVLLIALVCVYFLAPKVSGWIEDNTKLREKVTVSISESLGRDFEEKGAQTDEQQSEAMKESWLYR